jgi:hypothetical protein
MSERLDDRPFDRVGDVEINPGLWVYPWMTDAARNAGTVAVDAAGRPIDETGSGETRPYANGGGMQIIETSWMLVMLSDPGAILNV